MVALLCLLLSLELAPPMIILDHASVEPVKDARNGTFFVKNIRIDLPEDAQARDAVVVPDTTFIINISVVDHWRGTSYKLIPRGKMFQQEDGLYSLELIVTGGRFPLTRAQVSCEFELLVFAHAVLPDGTESKSATAGRTFKLSKEEFLPKP